MSIRHLYESLRLASPDILKNLRRFILTRIFSYEYLTHLFQTDYHSVQDELSCYIQYKTLPIRPIRSAYELQLSSTIDTTRIHSDILCLIQGPVSLYTLKTVEMYKSLFPGLSILVSTWDTSDDSIIKSLSSLCDYLVLHKQPSYAGYMNINYQLISSSIPLGIDLSHFNYVLKHRSDQRIYDCFSLAWFKSRLLKEPEKILVLSLGTSPTINYQVGDHLVFASFRRYLLYWNNCPLKSSLDDQFAKSKLKWSPSYRNGKLIFPEQWLGYHYCHQTNYDFVDQVSFLSSNFICIDPSIINMHWSKRLSFLSEYHLPSSQLSFPYRQSELDPRHTFIQSEVFSYYCPRNSSTI